MRITDSDMGMARESRMELIIDKSLRSEKDVKDHPLFGKAIFAECGYHNPAEFCYDHHRMGSGHLTGCKGKEEKNGRG